MGLRASLGVLVTSLRNPRIAAVELAYVGFSLAEWTVWIGMLVYAFGVGGATAVGIAAVVQLAPAAVLAPLAAAVGDRYRRDLALLLAYLVQGVSILALALGAGMGAPVPAVFALAAVANATMTLSRPLQAALIPMLADTPSEVTAANVANGTIQNVAILAGPGLAGVGLAVSGPALIFLASGVTALAAGLLISLTVVRSRSARVLAGSTGGTRPLRALRDGVAATMRPGRTRTVVAIFALAELVWGAVDVLIVVLAIELLRLGEPAVGYLSGIFGLGGLVGATMTVALIGRPRLGVPFGVGVALFGLPLALLAAGGGPVLAALLLAVAGSGRSLLDVTGRTLIQRIAPHALLARIFGVLEGIDMAALATGSLLASAGVAAFGAPLVFAAVGLMLPVAALLASGSLRQIDQAAEVHLVEAELLRRSPIFAPLPQLVLERLAGSVVPAHAEPGHEIVRQGDPGERYYVVAAGEVEVLVDGRAIRRLNPGEGFGEIALLRSVPRTASVVAVTETELLALDREPFLEAVTGHPQSGTAAEAVVAAHLSPTG